MKKEGRKKERKKERKKDSKNKWHGLLRMEQNRLAKIIMHHTPARRKDLGRRKISWMVSL
jgi:hypothetical protein